MNVYHCKKYLIASLFFFSLLTFRAQVNTKQKGLLWEISGNGLKKSSYVYGTMHISNKLAFHLGDSFYLTLAKCQVVALEQNLDSVIYQWISESGTVKPEDADRVAKRNTNEFLKLDDFTLRNYDKELVMRKLSAEVKEVNYLLKRGNEDDFEEDAWLDLYIYQLGKRMGKIISGVEGYEESKALVEKSMKEPEGNKDNKKKLKSYNNKLREQLADAYRKGNIYMIDSIDRMTESDHHLEYMLYKRNENMVRRMDSIYRDGKTLFTGVGCAHLPGKRGVLQLLVDMGYKVRPVQSLSNEKSKLAAKYENMTYAHQYQKVKSEDQLISAVLPSRLTRVRNTGSYSSYLCPDLANGYYYQVEKITCNTVFSGKTQEDILSEIDTMIFENIPGDVKTKEKITSNGFPGIEIVTVLKTGDLNRFQILTSPFNVYIIRLSGKKKFAASKQADVFFKSIKIYEGDAASWHAVSSVDSVFSLMLPAESTQKKLNLANRVDPSFEHLVFEKSSGNTYLIKQLDFLNDSYIEEDTFELGVMAKSFSLTNSYSITTRKQFSWQGYHTLDATFEGKNNEKLLARFVICGTRYIMFLLKPGQALADFENRFFTSIRFNGKPSYNYISYNDTNIFFTVKSPCMPMIMKVPEDVYEYDMYAEENVPDKYSGKYTEMYFRSDNANEFIAVGGYRYGYYEKQLKKNEDYYTEWEKQTSLKIIKKYTQKRKDITYYFYDYTDTNTNRNMRMMSAQNGSMRYYVSAFVDTVSGRSAFVDTFFSTFRISDSLIGGNVMENKGYLFFRDFAGKDSLSRQLAIKHFKDVVFAKEDIKDLKNAIDTIYAKSDASKLKSGMIFALGLIDSADALIVPFLNQLYAKAGDTAYLQIEILQALAQQRSEMAYKAIKPILAEDIPISDSKYDMDNLLFTFNDSLKLTRIILPELIELTTIAEYRTAAYSIISQLKDSGIIKPNDYMSIHNRLVTEARLEYKRTMAALASGSGFGNMDYNQVDYGTDAKAQTLFNAMLNLSLPLAAENKIMRVLTDKILEITDNDIRLELLPVLMNNGFTFNDSVYESLAKNEKTRIQLYHILAKAKQLNKYPEKYRSQKMFVTADIKNKASVFSPVDSIIFLEVKDIQLGKKNYLMYLYKVHVEDEYNWIFYSSDPMPSDTSALFDEEEPFPFYAQSVIMEDDDTVARLLDDLLFDTYMKYVRERNGGYYEENYDRQNDAAMAGEWDY